MATTQKLADYVIQLLEERGIEHIFLISGGATMHLVDAIGRAKKIKYVCNYHEQACAIAAECYSRFGKIAACNVTTGPGGTNALTGIAGAWLDSIPMLMIAGQVNVETTVGYTGLPLRQFGYQELDMVEMVKSITKYAVMVKNPYEVRYHIDKALYLATHGRPGPVWVEIPLNIQGTLIEPEKMKSFDLSAEDMGEKVIPKNELIAKVTETLKRIKNAKRPVLLAGNGIRLAGAADEFLKLVDVLKIPVLSSFAGYDLIDSAHPLYMGRPHTFAAQRAANFILQNCDLLLSIGTRHDVGLVSYNFKAFAREAFKIIVDIDLAELKKPSVNPDLPIHADAKNFIEEMTRQLSTRAPTSDLSEWIAYGKNLNKRYPAVQKEFWEQEKYANSYCFIDRLSEHLKSDDILVVSDGTALTCTYQAFRVKQGQRVVCNSGCAAMGYGLPAAIGACFANNKKAIFCIEGDGSLQLNIQELQTLKHHNLPIKLFVYNNQGYLAIKITQDTFMEGRHTASDPSGGVSIPDFVGIATAYGIPAIRMSLNAEIDQKITEAMQTPGPVLCEIMMDPQQPLVPKLRADRKPDGALMSKPLEDLYPFLPREEFMANMIIPPFN